MSSSVLKWPDAKAVDKAVRSWAKKALQEKNEVCGIGYFGSYARGDWGVGSDLDLVVVLKSSKQSFLKRSMEFDTTELPVPVDVLVYTEDEWQALDKQSKFYQTLAKEIVWVYILPGFRQNRSSKNKR